MAYKLFVQLAFVFCLFAGLSSARAQDTWRQYLSGHNKDDAVAWKILCNSGRNSNAWTTIPVPSNWELQGFGTFTYGVELGRVPRLANAVQDQYRHNFQVPANWSERRVFLVFEGVMTDTTEGSLTAVLQADNLFLQAFTPQYPAMNLAGSTFAPFPAAAISFLHAIPAMGSKFIAAENSGPQGMKTVAASDYRGSVSFFFGK